MSVLTTARHFLFAILLLATVRSEFYPSIQWTPQNPIFATNRTLCVRPMSTVTIVCPNTATLITIRPDPVYKNKLYENFWLVSRQSYERCEVNTSDPKQQRLLECDQPVALKYYSVVFQKYSAHARLEFDPGMDYYFIATSDGNLNSLKQTSGGHCKTHNMRLKIHVCTDRKDPRCKSDAMCNGELPAPTTRKTKVTTTSVAATPTAIASGNTTCGQVLTHTTSKPPGGPKTRVNMLFSELGYQIAVGFLLTVCLLLLLITVILGCRLYKARKLAAASSNDRSSFTIRLSDDGRNSDSRDGLLWEFGESN